MTSFAKSISIEEAQKIIAEVRGQIECPEALVSCAERQYRPIKGAEQTLEQFGYRGWQLLKLGAHLNVMRKSTDQAAGSLQQTGRIQQADIARRLAVGLHGKAGACEEMAAVVWMRRADFWMVSTGPASDSPEAQRDWHSFVICNVTAGQLKVGDTLDVLQKVKRLIVIDPLFNFVCKGSDIPTTGKSLADYWKAYGHTKVVSVARHKDFSKSHAALLKEAALIWQESQQYRSKVVGTGQQVVESVLLHQAIARHIKPHCEQVLAAVVPGATWTLKMKSFCDYELVTAGGKAAEQLEARAIPFARNASGEITLDNPDPARLDSLPVAIERITKLSPANVRLILHLAGLT
jgi:hypothetical protein